MMNKKPAIVTILSITFVVLLSYQNCGVESPQGLFDVKLGYKIPYEAKVDQIAYLSCSEQKDVPNDSGVYFTFRVGAYGENAGLRLNDNFLYQARNATPQFKANLLSQEVNSALHRLEFSVRPQSDLQSIYKNADSGEGIEGIDYDFIFGDLGSDAMSASLVSLPDDGYLSYWSAGGVSQDAFFQGSMAFNSSELLAASLRTFMTDSGIITLGYSTPSFPAALLTRAPYNTTNEDDDGDGQITDADDDIVPSNQAFGVGLKLSFKQPDPLNWGGSGSPHTNLPKRVLNSVSEIDLSYPTRVKSTWTCPSKLQFRVVYPTDKDIDDPFLHTDDQVTHVNNGAIDDLCPDAADPTTPASEVALFQRVRNSLPVSDWKINWARRCVVPKRYTKGSCYGIDTSPSPSVTNTPQYNFTRSCDPAVNPYVCSHFVSICYKP